MFCPHNLGLFTYKPGGGISFVILGLRNAVFPFRSRPLRRDFLRLFCFGQTAGGHERQQRYLFSGKHAIRMGKSFPPQKKPPGYVPEACACQQTGKGREGACRRHGRLSRRAGRFCLCGTRSVASSAMRQTPLRIPRISG